MRYKKGERVRHPMKKDWGLGQVLEDSNGETVKIFFGNAGEKVISLKYVQPHKLLGKEAADPVLDNLNFTESPKQGKQLCNNCGDPTLFGRRTNFKRAELGWCDSCFKQSQRTFKDKATGKERYLDELRTIDGIKNRYGPK